MGRLFPSIWQGSEFNNETGRDQLKELFNGKAVFENPKPVDLIKHLLLLAGGNDGVVLDPFAGSGTTGQAVLELNNSDSGTRRFLLVEEQDFADSITAERVRRVINVLPNPRMSNSFSFVEIGHPMQLETLLKADRLPSYADLASYIFYTATGEDFDTGRINRKTGFIGESAQYDVYLLYEPDVDYLRSTALTLDVARSLPKGSGKKRLLFAPTKYLDSVHLAEHRIEFCQLPFEIYKAVKRTS